MTRTLFSGFLAALCLVPALAATASAEAPKVTLESLLNEMIDVAAIARWPNPEYTCLQFGSYDKRTKTPADPKGWFANGDNMESMGVPVTWEKHQGRNEALLLDAEGPGAIVRFWSGGAPPKGKIRFYLDGAESPAIEAPLQDLFSGKGFVPRPLAIENAGRGINFYLPLPFAKHCKITYDEGTPPKAPPGRWYNVEWRRYAPGTDVQTFTMESYKALEPLVARVAKTLLAPPAAEEKPGESEMSIGAGEETIAQLPNGPAAITHLSVQLPAADAAAMSKALRSLVLVATFDGQQTIWCPLGEFFGAGVGLNEVKSWNRTVGKDGTLSCRFVMPYEKSATVSLLNLGASPLRAEFSARTGPWQWDDRSMHFHAAWRWEQGINTRPYKDWNYVDVKGRGVYVGDTLAVVNPTRAWWGEGDEKIFVDGEKFPSHIGTGSEDYYGYAWGAANVFQGPFCNQPRAGARNQGHTTNTRVRSLDAIPFKSSLSTNIEVWHWAACKMTYSAAAYWYARPGAEANVAANPAAVKESLPQLGNGR